MSGIHTYKIMSCFILFSAVIAKLCNLDFYLVELVLCSVNRSVNNYLGNLLLGLKSPEIWRET